MHNLGNTHLPAALAAAAAARSSSINPQLAVAAWANHAPLVRMDEATILARYDASLSHILDERHLAHYNQRDTPLSDPARLLLASAAFCAFVDAIPDLLGDMTLVKMFLAEAFESSGELLERARELVSVHLTFRVSLEEREARADGTTQVITLEQLLRTPVSAGEE